VTRIAVITRVTSRYPLDHLAVVNISVQNLCFLTWSMAISAAIFYILLATGGTPGWRSRNLGFSSTSFENHCYISYSVMFLIKAAKRV